MPKLKKIGEKPKPNKTTNGKLPKVGARKHARDKLNPHWAPAPPPNHIRTHETAFPQHNPYARKPGRPTKYHSGLPGKLIAHMAGGFSAESFAAQCGVSIKTIWNWLKEHEEFLRAKEIGEALSMEYHERLLHHAERGIGEPVLQGEVREVDAQGYTVIKRTYGAAKIDRSALIFGITNRFRKYGWQNYSRHEHSGPEGRPIQSETTVHDKRPDLSKLSKEELREWHRMLTKATADEGEDDGS